MKILYIYDSMPETYQNYLWGVLENLGNYHEVKSLSYKKHPKADFVMDFHGWRRKAFTLLRKLRLVRNERLDLQWMASFDLVHLQHSYLFPKLKGLLNIPAGSRPLICITLRGGDTYVKPHMSEKWRRFYRESNGWIDSFVVMSEHQRDYLRRWGIEENRIEVIPISFGKPEDLRAKSPNKEILRLVSAFRMCWEKDIARHLECAKYLKTKGIPFQYDFYGDGPDLDQLYFLRSQMGLEQEVRVLGKISNAEFRNVLPSYDFLMQLSRSESLGMSVIESQTLGVPPIVSNEGGLPEVVRHFETGWVCDLASTNAILDEAIKVWKDESLYRQYSERARLFATERFSLKKELSHLNALYERLASR